MAERTDGRGRVPTAISIALLVGGGLWWGVTVYREGRDTDVQDLEYLGGVLLALFLLLVGRRRWAVAWRARRRRRVSIALAIVLFVAAGLWSIVAGYRESHDTDVQDLEYLDEALLTALLLLLGVGFLIVGLAHRSAPLAGCVAAGLVATFSLLQGGASWLVVGLGSLVLTFVLAGRWIRDLPR